jgi:sugar/nucleoside kinase (ribokinase family)
LQHPQIHIVLLTLDAGDHDSVVMSEAAMLAQSANKLVMLRASPLSESRGIVDTLWENSNILIVTETEAAIAIAASNSEWEDESTTSSTPLRTLQQCAEAAQQMLWRSSTAVAVIVSSAMGVSCRVNVERVQKLHRRIMPPVAVDVAAEVEDGVEYTITLPCFRGPVVDVVGAVDALTGGIAAALARGVPLSHALVWGTACCDRSISEHGAQDSMPSMEQLQGFFRLFNVRVAVDQSVGTTDTWPVDKPSVGHDVRDLEELLHSGARNELIEALFTLNETLSTEARNMSEVLSVAVDFQGQSLLHLAVLYGDITSVLMLLSYGANIVKQDNYGKTPLQRCDVEFRAARGQARER